ncbi:hypothetical protein OA238_118p1200 (plasmid) [Octadecabacter arcticus 238]|uniref:Uncharacterized protein n=1 Tax=Octadecabacter arcticus 238 TaxID=391616 RepID=M9RY42_9RHOB|nr:hypothetical protein [Octadecabacter arcticus]AGI74815.1 hypothetical protein OA238_118p1200 [Octadecabacter arcticus 238]
MTNTFNPLDFGFDKLDLQHGSLRFYEYCSGDFCDGKVNPHRINVYLTQDGDFVTVWDGLFDTAFVSQAFHDLIGKVGLGDVDFFTTYHTPLFRGHIETQDEAKIILKALRFDRLRPSIIRIDEDNRICCDSL